MGRKVKHNSKRRCGCKPHKSGSPDKKKWKVRLQFGAKKEMDIREAITK